MLTALSTLPAQLKTDPAPATPARPGAALEGDHSFASLIRRQAEQRLDTLRLADQQALAARVSAAAAASMPRPVIDPLASRPPMPGQAPARPGPPPPSPAPVAATAPAKAPAGPGGSPPSPAQTQPPQAAAARPKSPGTANRPENPRSPAARHDQADGPTANRSQRERERKAATASGAEGSADEATASAASLPLPLADASPTGLVGDGAAVAAPDLAAGLQPGSGLAQDLTALPAAQAPAAAGTPAGPDAQTLAATGPIGSRSALARQPAASSALAKAGALTTAAVLPPDQAAADDLVPAVADPGSPAPSQARSASVPALGVDPQDLGADGAVTAAVALAQPSSEGPEPAAESPLAQRRQSPGGHPALTAAPPDGVAATAPPGAWRPAPAASDDPAAPADTPPTSRRAGPGIDRGGPEPRHAAGPAAGSSAAAAALQAAQAQPDAATPRAFHSALQAALTLSPANSGTVGGTVGSADSSAELPLALQIDAAVDSPLFAPALGSQLSLLARDGVRSALLQLHPAEMGPISVAIALDGNAARIDFQALRADTRSLIEASLPALAGALQDAGLTLAGGGVFEQAPGRQPPPQAQAQAQAEPAPGARPAGPADSGPAGPLDTAQMARRTAPRGLVDLVA